jgi:tetraacyldisaccharide 4'-kinase
MKDFLYSIATDQRRDLLAQLVRLPLLLASVLYGAAVRMILAGYHTGILRRKHLSVPVISVGNLTLGGVGKTPMVIYVARLLKAKGFKPAVLTRGYMPEGQADASDEAQVLRQVLDGIPVVVDRDRYRGGLKAIEDHRPDVIILDDGFQHWRLFRNMDIVLVDAVNPFGNKHALPAGILREPLSSLKRADVVVLTKTDQADAEALKEYVRSLHPKAPILKTIHRPTALVNTMTGNLLQLTKLEQPVVAFCGVGNPESFKATLASLNAACKEWIVFADHHPYGLADMERLKVACEKHQIHTLVTTQKDAVKFEAFRDFWQGYEVYSLNIEIDITQGQHEFVDRISHLLHG